MASNQMLQVVNVTKRFGGTLAVDDVSISIRKGEILSLIGPSGCGKTTTLRCIAGLESIQKGEIIIDGNVVSSASRKLFMNPEKRDLGLLFQSYALFPHMTVRQNISYGLKSRKFPQREVQTKLKNWMELLRIAHLAERYPSQLSGGEQQRVALARCLVYEPKLILLDEPLSNLDARERERVRYELHRLLESLDSTALYVTHDQEEAFVISDRVAVMNRGKVVQEGRPEAVYAEPRDEFVANFVGRVNIFQGSLRNKGAETSVLTLDGLDKELVWRGNVLRDGCYNVVIRPTQVELKSPGEAAGATNVFSGEVVYKGFRGSTTEYRIAVGKNELLVIEQKLRQAEEFQPGTKVEAHMPVDAIALLPTTGT